MIMSLGEVKLNLFRLLVLIYIGFEEFGGKAGARSLKLVLVLLLYLGPLGPPKKRVNLDMLKKD